jgi:hypothetical protein
MLSTDELQIPDGMDVVGVLQVLIHRGDVVVVLDANGEVSGFYEANHGEHDRLIHVPPEFRWTEAAKLGEARLHNRGVSDLRDFKLDDVLVRKPDEVPPLASVLGRGPGEQEDDPDAAE